MIIDIHQHTKWHQIRPAGTETFCKVTDPRTRDLQHTGNHFTDQAVQIDADLDPQTVALS